MAFTFGFANDDGDSDDELRADGSVKAVATEITEGTTASPMAHRLEELLSGLPERLSYSTIEVKSPLGRTVNLPRRDLDDVRAQLLGEGDKDYVVDQIDKSDILKGIYEGGFKTWECSVDLASLLLDRGPRKDIDELVRCDQIVELGVGTGLPSLVLFRHALINSISGLTFTLADYNEEVLQLVTLPNLLLTWAICCEVDEIEQTSPANNSGDLEITTSLLERFKSKMESLNMRLSFLSGPWSKSLAELIPDSAPDMGLVVLAAETIYSPPSTTAFVQVLGEILGRVKMAKAMVGAKRMYFGVGGSVDGLKEACRDRGMVAYEIENHGVPGMNGGVGRALIEVQMY